MASKGIKYVCDRCGKLIDIGSPRFIFKGELTAAYDGGIFDETHGGTSEEIQDEMKRLIELAEQKSGKELNDEVHYSFKMDLCIHCRNEIYQTIENRK